MKIDRTNLGSDYVEWFKKYQDNYGWTIVETSVIVSPNRLYEEGYEIDNRFSMHGYWWAFEKEEDAVMFKLVWA